MSVIIIFTVAMNSLAHHATVGTALLEYLKISTHIHNISSSSTHDHFICFA